VKYPDFYLNIWQVRIKISYTDKEGKSLMSWHCRAILEFKRLPEQGVDVAGGFHLS
jgi:hypothetical protein